MPIYKYTAKSDPLNAVEGEIEAESEQDAAIRLTQKGLFPVTLLVRDLSSQEKSLLSIPRVSRKDIAFFTSKLASLINSDINILDSLNMLSAQTVNKHFQSVLADVSAKIKDGRNLSSSLSSYPREFSAFYIAMVGIGEASGKMGESLASLSSFIEKEEEFKDSLLSALIYPLFIMAISVLTVIILLGFVIPKLVTMFLDVGQELPLPTKILINVSSGLKNYWWVGLVIIAALLYALSRLGGSAKYKLFVDSFLIKAPALKDIIIKTEVARFCRTLSVLFSSGMPITPALAVTRSVVSNKIFASEIQGIEEKINTGSSLSAALKGSAFFFGFTVNVLSVGEETGTLSKSLMRIAEDYEKDTDRQLKVITRLIEPVIILIMGLVVAFIVISMLLPVFQINLMAK